jgi:tetratricopeptide (TPR) repeat protein
MISLAAVSVITALAVCTVRRTPFLLVGWLWYLGTLIPVIGMVQAGTQQRADRFTYLPMIGIYVSVVWLVAWLVGNRRWARVCASAAVGIVLLALMIVTYHQVGYWQNSESLFRRAIAVTERNVIAHNNLGTALAESDRLDEAREQFQRAVDIAPDYADGHFNLARTLSATGKPEESLAHLHKAVELNPNFAAAHNSLGIAYVHAGRPDVAIKHFERAVEIDPKLTPAVVNLEQVRRAVRDAR